MTADRIVLNIPHASPVFPFGKAGWGEGIDVEISRWTDHYTDWLFASATRLDSRIVAVQFPFSRFFCDAERLEDDPLEAVGQGIVYRNFNGLKRMVQDEDEPFIRAAYLEHQERLRAAILSPSTILIDCHSFPEDLSDVDICIGVNDDWSRPEERFLRSTVAHFSESGYRTEINKPYSNSMTPKCDHSYMSVMIEVNKGTYLRPNGELNPEKALRLRGSIESYFRGLLSGGGHPRTI